MQDDINRSISQNPSSTFDPSLAELELELSDILSEGNDSSGFFGGGLPEVPTHEPEPVGFTSFSPERGNFIYVWLLRIYFLHRRYLKSGNSNSHFKFEKEVTYVAAVTGQ